MAELVVEAAPEPDNDLVDVTEIECRNDENQAVTVFSYDTFAHALSGATVSNFN